MRCHVAMPTCVPAVNRAEALAYRAELILVDGLIDRAGSVIRESGQASGWFDVSALHSTTSAPRIRVRREEWVVLTNTAMGLKRAPRGSIAGDRLVAPRTTVTPPADMMAQGTKPLLTVRELLSTERFHLRLLEGAGGLDRPIRWAHATDLLDPRPWLRGGEFVMTMGSALTSPQDCQAFMTALGDVPATGIGFGIGNFHDTPPNRLRQLCAERELPLLEIPYSVSFLSIIELMADRLATRRSEDVRRMRRREARLLATLDDGLGPTAMVRLLAREFGGTFVVASEYGHIEALAGPVDAAVQACCARANLTSPHAPSVARATVGGWTGDFETLTHHRRRVGWLGWVHSSDLGGQGVPQVLHEVAPIVAIGLAARLDERARDWRHVGRLLDLVMQGIAGPAVLMDRISEARLPVDGVVAAAWPLEASSLLAEILPKGSIIGQTDNGVLTILHPTFNVVAHASQSRVRVGVGSIEPVDRMATTLREATTALAITDQTRQVASWRDLATLDALLEQQPIERTTAFAAQLVLPLRRHDPSGALLATLRSYLEEDGGLEATASRLNIHPNSVRNRLHKIESIVGRDPFRFVDRASLYVAIWAWDHGLNADR